MTDNKYECTVYSLANSPKIDEAVEETSEVAAIPLSSPLPIRSNAFGIHWHIAVDF